MIIMGIPKTNPIILKHATAPKITNNKPIVFLTGLKRKAMAIKSTNKANNNIF